MTESEMPERDNSVRDELDVIIDDTGIRQHERHLSHTTEPHVPYHS